MRTGSHESNAGPEEPNVLVRNASLERVSRQDTLDPVAGDSPAVYGEPSGSTSVASLASRLVAYAEKVLATLAARGSAEEAAPLAETMAALEGVHKEGHSHSTLDRWV